MTAKILVVDDSLSDLMIIQNLSVDYDVITACNGLDAMSKIDMDPDIALVVLDLNNPEMDSFQMLEELKSSGRCKRMHIVILRNNDEIYNEIKGLNLGSVDYIRKPIKIESLKARMEVHLEMIRMQNLIEERYEDNNLTLEIIFGQAPIGIIISYGDGPCDDPADNPAIINPMFEKITGRSREELIRLGWSQITHPDDVQKDLDNFSKLLAGEIDSYSMEKRFSKPDGSFVWTYITVAPLTLKNNSKYKHICLVHDISEHKNAEINLCESERSKSVLLSNLPGMAYRCSYDREWTMKFISQGCFDLTGYQPESLINNRDVAFNDLIVSEYQESIRQQWERVLALKLPFKYEYQIITAAGEIKWVLEMGQGIFNEQGKVEALEGIIIDITDRKEKEIKLNYISDHDSLTGLNNRRYFENLLSKDAMDNKNKNRAIVLLNLKKINTISLSYGYSFSEDIIKELSVRLLSMTKENIKLFQISLERIAFYINGFEEPIDLSYFCEDIFKVLSEIQIINAIGCGIGVLIINDSSCNAEIVIRNASIAAEHAGKNTIFGYCFFDSGLKEKVSRETNIKDELLMIANDKSNQSIYLHYQPIIDLKTGRISGFEALARMKSERVGIVPPLEFIPLAEELQLIVPIGLRIIRMACSFLKDLKIAGYKNMKVSVNISLIQLLRDDFIDEVTAILEETQCDLCNFCIEVTESVFADNFQLINEKLGKLKDMGIVILIDDFGTGYSSLSRAREMNINCLKIDKYFIDKLGSISPEQAITGDIISMAQRLGYLVVAEGVEDEKQMQYLTDHGCDLMQGYIFSRPIRPQDALELLKKTNADFDRNEICK